MTEQEAKRLIQTRKAICDFRFFILNFREDFDPKSEYRTHWLWHDQSGDIWFDYEDVLDIEGFMNISPSRIKDTSYMQKWLRMFLKKRPSFDFPNLKDELYLEIQAVVFQMFVNWFRYNKEGRNWNVCDPIMHKPHSNDYTNFDDLINDTDKLITYFNLDVWKKVIDEYQVPYVTLAQVNEYKRTIEKQQEHIIALESELNMLKGISKIENNIAQLNMGHGTQYVEQPKLEQQ